MDREAITAALNACLVENARKEDLVAGLWRGLPDPFPLWQA